MQPKRGFDLKRKVSDLPIYRAGYGLAKLTTSLTKQFSRDLRGSLGRRMQDESVMLVLDIYSANASINKVSEIESILHRIQAMELSYQLSYDLRQINRTALGDAFDVLEGLGKQAGGWLKYAKKRTLQEAECSPSNN